MANRRIRVGLLSACFKFHTIGHLMRGLVAQLSRDRFEVTVLSIGNHDDEIASFFRQHGDRFVKVPLPANLPAARRLIAEQNLDVLFYTDIGMDPMTYTLAFSRLAPVQCVTWGHPETTGIDTIDYFISAEDLEIAEADRHYTETLVRLKTSPIYYYRPERPGSGNERDHFGFSNKEHIYACPQSHFKFHPEFDTLIAGILRGDPRGKLVLIGAKCKHWDELLRRRFAAAMPEVLDRIRFLPAMPRQDYLKLLKAADVLLDPLHFTGGNSSYEAFAVGTPVVTLPSQFLRGRITLSLYKQMQVNDCVAHRPEEYVSIALQIGMDAAFREGLRRKILAANSVLFENSTGIRELEQFFVKAVAR